MVLVCNWARSDLGGPEEGAWGRDSGDAGVKRLVSQIGGVIGTVLGDEAEMGRAGASSREIQW